jgi:hypothetical protein
MSGADRRRQKKLEKNRKKRAEAKQSVRKRELELTGASLMRKAREAPFGPTFISEAIDDTEHDAEHHLNSVLVTRKVAGMFVPHLILVDRACFGVKDATLFARMSEAELSALVDSLADGLGGLRPCEPELAQSVVFHALDYARRLGFAPGEHFRLAMVEPRPEQLLETPLANRARPLFINGPGDDVAQTRERLADAVGPDGYDFIAASEGDRDIPALFEEGFGLAEDEFDPDLEDEDIDADGDPAVIEATGTPLEKPE